MSATPAELFIRTLDAAVGSSGLTMQRLSLALGYSQSAISQVRNGNAKNMTADMAGRLEVHLEHPGLAELLLVLQAQARAAEGVALHRELQRRRTARRD